MPQKTLRRRGLLLTLALVAAATIGAAPASAHSGLSLPRPTGHYQLGRADVHLTFPGRELMATLWYPARFSPDLPLASQFTPRLAEYYEKSAAQAYGIPLGSAGFANVKTHARIGARPVPGELPVVLYSPSGRHSRALGTTLAEELASRGYLVVAVDHTFDGPVDFPDRLEPPRPGEARQLLETRASDLRAVLDRLAVPLVPGLRPDLSKVGLFGHSMGGFASAVTMLADPRIRAGVNLDGTMGAQYAEVVERGLERPFLLMGGGLDSSSGLPHHHRHEPGWNQFWNASTGWKRDVYLRDAEHMSFTDLQVLVPQIAAKQPIAPEILHGQIGSVDPARSLATQRAYLTEFFGAHLLGRGDALFDRTSPRYPEAELIG